MSTALVVRVGANISDFQREMNEVAKTASQVGQSMIAVGQTLSRKVTAPLMGIVTAATLVGSEFEKKMSTVEATTGASAAEMEKLERIARDLGSTTIFGARQVSGAMDAMGLAGWNASQVYDALPGVLDLAASSGLDLKKSTSIVTSAVNAFGLEASEAGRVVDVLATANKNSNISVDGLGDALKYVGSVAGMFGYTIEDVSLAIGLMANGGMAASQAGTSLRAAISELADPSEQAKILMEELGVSMFDAEGEAKPLQTVLKDLRNGLEGMSTEQENAALSTIFGTTALTGMSHIINASEADFDNLISNLESADGNAAKFAETMQDNLHSELAIFRSRLEEAGIAIFQVIVPALRRFVERITNLVDSFNNLNPKTQEFIIKVAGIAAAIGPVLIIGGKFIRFLATLKTSFAILKGAKAIGGVKTALGAKGLVGGFGKAKGAAGLFGKAIVGIKAAPFVAAGALVVGAAYGIHKSFQQEAIPSIDDLADRIVGLEGYAGDASMRISEETQEIVGSFASMHLGAMTEIKALGSSMNSVTETQMEDMAYKITGMTNHTIEELERRRDEGLATLREHYEEEGELTREEIDARIEESYNGWNQRIEDQRELQAQMLETLEKAFDDEGGVVQEHFDDLIEMMETYREDAMEVLVTDIAEREFIMATWRDLEEEEQQQHFLRLVEMAREHHYDQIEALEGQTGRELAMLANHYGSGLEMTTEHHRALRDEMSQQHIEERHAINAHFENLEERMKWAYESGEWLTDDYHDALLGLLRQFHADSGGENSQAFKDDLALLDAHFGQYTDLTTEQHDLIQRLIKSSHEDTTEAASKTHQEQLTDLAIFYMDGNALTTEQMNLIRDNIARSHAIRERDLKTSLDNQLGYYQDTFADISRAIDVETGKQYNYWQYRRLLIEEGMGGLAATWNALGFRRHRATVEVEEISLNPLSFPGFANGTFNAPGGMTWVNERGAELINLPQGSQVIPAPLSSLMMQNLGRSLGRENVRNTNSQTTVESNSVNHNYNFTGMFDGSNINIREEKDIRRLAEDFAWLTQKQSAQMGGA